MQECLTRSVLTVATGKRAYWDMAISLARSFEFWNSGNGIGFCLLTDRDDELPKDLRVTSLTRVRPGQLGEGFSSKLYIDLFAPAAATLFVDADCFCLGDLTPVFKKFAGRSVSVVGGEISEGEWFGDVASVCAAAGVPALPKFNGGIYYVERGEKATQVYERARLLEPRYDELGLVRLRGRPNDELILAIAMAQEGCGGIPEDGTVMGEFFSTPVLVDLDVLAGTCLLRNPDPPHPQHRAWCSLRESRPLIVHFLGAHVSGWVYRREALRLKLSWLYGVAVPLARLAGTMFSIPFKLAELMKDMGRPCYRVFFRPRRVRPGIR